MALSAALLPDRQRIQQTWCQRAVQGTWIDWKQLSYYLPVHNCSHVTKRPCTKQSLEPDTTKEMFVEGMERILADKEGYEQTHRAVLANRELFDYTTLYPFDTYLYMLQAHLYPETRRQQKTLPRIDTIGHSSKSIILLPPRISR